jgi:acyl-CoA reductase-like NAD-dependent aldehyde dehydrogenase
MTVEQVKTYKHYINGQWVESHGGSIRTIVSPATGETLANVAEGTAADVDRAVEGAKAAFETTPRPASVRPRS